MSKYAEKIVLDCDLYVRGTDDANPKAVEAVDHVIGLLRHAIQRNHPINLQA